jgi:hypothetical protein
MPTAWTTPVGIFKREGPHRLARDGELVNDNPELEGQRGAGSANVKTTPVSVPKYEEESSRR